MNREDLTVAQIFVYPEPVNLDFKDFLQQLWHECNGDVNLYLHDLECMKGLIDMTMEEFTNE